MKIPIPLKGLLPSLLRQASSSPRSQHPQRSNTGTASMNAGATTVVDSVSASNGVARVRSTTSGSVTFAHSGHLDGTVAT